MPFSDYAIAAPSLRHMRTHLGGESAFRRSHVSVFAAAPWTAIYSLEYCWFMMVRLLIRLSLGYLKEL